MEKKALFLDFDGVLFDTLKEVYLVNRYIYSNIDLKEKVDEKNYKLYSKYKFLVYNIWMFYYFNPILFENTKEEDIVNTFNDAISNRNLEKEKEFCEKFIDVRKELVKNHYDFWNNLETPYDFFLGIKKLYEEKKPEIFVVSKKNKQAIIQRFKSYNFNLDSNRIFAREILDTYKNKGEFINEFMIKNHIDKAIFVDDNNNNIKTCDDLCNVTQILALWGNPQPNSTGYNQIEALDKINRYFH